MYFLILIALAITGEVLPEENNRFFIIAGERPPILLTNSGRIWEAKIMDRPNLTYIPQGAFDLNGLAIGHKKDESYDYHDMSEILSIETIVDLAERERFEVQGGLIYVDHSYQQGEAFKGLKVELSPKDITAESLTVIVLWEKQPNQEMMLPDSQERKLTHADVEDMSEIELNVARNEIFARHGYVFNSKQLAFHFNSTSWYQAKTKAVSLSEVEQYNVKFLREQEAMRASEGVESSDQSQGSSSDGYLMPDSATRLLTQAELDGYSRQQLRLIRNEIFARHGYVFKSKQLNEYFSQKSWYRPRSNNIELSSVEAENVRLIKSVEQNKSSN